MDAARSLFESTPYHSVTIEDIVRQAGASRATFYLHYSNKRELLDDLIAPLRQHADQLWFTVGQAGAGDHATLVTAIVDFIEAIVEHRGAFTAWMQAGTVGPDLDDTTLHDLGRVRRLVFGPKPRGEAGRTQVAAAAVMVSGLEQLCVTWLRLGLGVTPPHLANALALSWEPLLDSPAGVTTGPTPSGGRAS